MASEVLDNPVWSSLHGQHTGLAELAGADGARAGRFKRDVSPFGALEDPDNPACWAALSSLLDGHAICVLVDPEAVPADWKIVMAIPGVQMDGRGLEPAEEPDAVSLTGADVPEILALIERTRPGPYLPRTVEMGRYIGIRDDGGALVAMAGERLHPTGWTEISAVCTDAEHRGRGLGTRLTRAVAHGIRARDEVPFLHAAADNVNAIRLYEALGFTLRRTCSFTIVKQDGGR